MNNDQRTKTFHCTFVDPGIDDTDVTIPSAPPTMDNVEAALSEHTGIDPKRFTLLNTETGDKIDRIHRQYIPYDITYTTVVVNPPPETKVYKIVIGTA